LDIETDGVTRTELPVVVPEIQAFAPST